MLLSTTACLGLPVANTPSWSRTTFPFWLCLAPYQPARLGQGMVAEGWAAVTTAIARKENDAVGPWS